MRAVRQFREKGPTSFFTPRAKRSGGTILTAKKLLEGQRLLDRGYTRQEVARCLQVKYDTLRKAINDERLKEPESNPPGTTLSERS